MAAPLIPQEVNLQERYVSVDYFGEMRDAWAAMVRHAEKCLDVFMHNLPPDYRKRSGEYQPDIVWGERVLVNFRLTLEFLNRGFIELTHGQYGALGYSGNALSDFIGFSRDYSDEWMDEPSVAKAIPRGTEVFRELMEIATRHASNIKFTNHAQWKIGSLTARFDDAYRGPLNPPAEWPSYRTNPKVRATSGHPAPRTGIYLPDVDDAPAAFFIEGKEVPTANLGYDPETMQRVSEKACSWTLVERAADTGGGVPGAADPVAAGIRLRCVARAPCPREGWWFTPAQTGSRRQFVQGELMPDVGGSYGVTIWQWDERQ